MRASAASHYNAQSPVKISNFKNDKKLEILKTFDNNNLSSKKLLNEKDLYYHNTNLNVYNNYSYISNKNHVVFKLIYLTFIFFYYFNKF